MKRIVTHSLLAAILAVASITCANGQSVAQEQFTSIPMKLRRQLFNRVALLAKYQRSENFGLLYDMLFGYVPQKLTRLQFIELMKMCNDNSFRGFQLGSIDKSVAKPYAEADWRITGVATISDTSGRQKRPAVVFAKLINGRWYFSGIAVARKEPLLCY